MPDIILQPRGPAGAPGTRILPLPSFPLTSAFGNDGDWALYDREPSRVLLFGPKVAGQWPQRGVLLNGPPGTPGIGSQGQNAWSALLGMTVDGDRRVQTIIDWVGGEGTKPTAVPIYVGPSGPTPVLANGIDVRGTAGAGSGDVVGPASATVGRIAVFGDTAGDTIREPTAGDLSTLKTSLEIEVPGLVLLAVATANNSAFLDFTNLSGYEAYLIVGKRLRPQINSDFFNVRFSTSNGVSYLATGYHWSRNVVQADGGVNSMRATTVPDTTFGRVTGAVGFAATQGTDFLAWTNDLTKIRPKTVFSTYTALNDLGQLTAGHYFAAHTTSSLAVNAIRCLFASGQIQSGVVQLFGLRTAVQ